MGARATLLAIPMALAAAPAAHAAEPTTPPIDLRIGLSLMQDRSARSIVDTAGFSIAVGQPLSSRPLLFVNGASALNLDFAHHTGARAHVDVLGLFYAERVKLVSSDEDSGRPVPYAGLGVGLMFTDVGYPVQVGGGGSSVATVTDTSHSALRLGGKLLVGVNFGRRIRAEAAYHVGGSAGGVKADRIDFSVGMRF